MAAPQHTSAGAAWSAASWRRYPAAQQPQWPEAEALKAAETTLSSLPPLVFAGEARRLTDQLGDVAQGRAFLLQAGDCAESFADFSADAIRDKLKIILQMAVALTYAAGVPVVKVGRIAGQFAKPRSSDTEKLGQPSWRRFGATWSTTRPSRRRARPDPTRLVAAYHQSASTLNLLRAFTKGGFADLSQVHLWNQQFVASSSRRPTLRTHRPRRSTGRCASWRLAESTSAPRPACTRSTFGLRTRRSSSLTKRP